MTHIEKIAEFVFEELSSSEMAEVERHLAECSGCREQVDQFRSTCTFLRMSPDVEPPRRMLFEFEKPRAASWMWRWLAPLATSAAVAFAVVSFAPRPQPQIVERVVQQPSAQPVDYQKVIDDIRAADRAWLVNELNQRDAAQAREIQRLRSGLISLDYYQRQIERSQWENARDVQLLAAKADVSGAGR